MIERETMALISNSDQKSSLARTLDELRRVAWLLRDRFSADTWRILSRLDHQFGRATYEEPLRIGSALDLLDDAIMTLSAFGGLVMESMTRGYGWRFLDIGRRIERAVQMVETIGRGLIGGQGDHGELQAVLEIADSSLTYRSRYLTSLHTDLVLDLLLLDEANPRSIAFQLGRLREYVDDLPKRTSSDRAAPEWPIVVRLLAAVQLADISELMGRGANGDCSQTETLLATLTAGLRSLSETITRDYFDHTIASRQLGGFVTQT
jgi:uncharacterized alpha-E superfamily protein